VDRLADPFPKSAAGGEDAVVSDETLLFDLGPLSCTCTDAALEGMYKALADPGADEGIWEPHHDPWLRDHIEDVTRRGQAIITQMRDALIGGMGLPEPGPLAKADPWQRWDAAEFDRVKSYLNAIPADRKTIDDWMLAVDWIIQRYMPGDTIQTEAEYAVVRAHIAGVVRARVGDTPLSDPRIAALVAALATRLGDLPPGITPRETLILDFAVRETAQHITDLTQSARARMKRTLIDGIKKMTLGHREGAWTHLHGALLDDFGMMNRDWRRIAITETGNATNTGFIASLAPGTQVRRKEAYRGACPFCAHIRDRVLTVVADDHEPKDFDNEVWPSKNNIGRSASPRKRVGNTLVEREPDEIWTIPAGLVHPHCFVSPKVPVYTSDGWKPIGGIREGDLVLTHRGRFRAVDWVMDPQTYTGDVIRLTVSFRGKNAFRLPEMTPEHPVLTESGWKAVGDLTTDDPVVGLAKTCPTCRSPFINGKHPSVLYCSGDCAPRLGKNQFATSDPQRYAEAVRQTAESTRIRMRGMTLEQRRALTGKGREVMRQRGYDHLQSEEVRNKANSAAASRNYLPSDAEKTIAERIQQLGHAVDLQHRIPKLSPDSLNRPRYWFADLAIPDAKIAVEIDGDYWHPRARDAERDADMARQGWTVLRFDSAEARQNPGRVADETCRIAMNHQQEYQFATLTIDAINAREARNARLYNFGVAEDESYIVHGGVVVHNCRGGWAAVSGGDTGVSREMAAYVRRLLTQQS
jgi:hypothetical protein